MSEAAAAEEGELRYPFPDYPEEGAAIEVAEGVFWLSTPLPFPGLRQINLWLLRDGDGWVMVDCGFGQAAVRDVIAGVWERVLRGRPITRLIVTHFHPDHAGNAQWICERWGGLRPLMTQAEWFAASLAILDKYTDNVAQRAEFYRTHGLDKERLAVFVRGHVLYSAGVMLPPAYERIGEGDLLTIDGASWQVITGEGHSPEHASLYCARRRLLISGDQILPTITTNISVWPSEPAGDPLHRFLETCRRYRGLIDPATLVLPSHRRPFVNVQSRLRQLAVHHAERLDLILQAAPAETTAADLIDVLFSRALDGHQMGFAMGEAIAHLNHLVTLGRMERSRDGSGIHRYRKLRGDASVAPSLDLT